VRGGASGDAGTGGSSEMAASTTELILGSQTEF
jgi:hypothetical protein